MSRHAVMAAVCGEKGGIGKSSSVHHFACSLAARGYSVCCVDFDPQGALAKFFGADNVDALNILDVLHGNATAEEAVQHVEAVGVDVIPANSALSAVDDFVKIDSKTLAGALAPLKRKYDFIFIDTEPEPKNKAIVAVLSAVDHVILPIQAEPQPVDCLAKMVGTVAKVKGRRGLDAIAVVVTKHFPRYNVYKDYERLIRGYCEKMDVLCLESFVRFSAVVVESQSRVRPLTDYKPNSPVAADYEQVVDELLRKSFDRPLAKGE